MEASSHSASAGNEDDDNVNGIRMIEFFSGIGGMRLGVENALNSSIARQSSTTGRSINSATAGEGKATPLISCKAYEISLHANQVYAFNFEAPIAASNTKQKSAAFTVSTKLVEQLKPHDVDGKSDLWTMSPPCQPFTTTRNAKQNDELDPRNKGFLALMKLLSTIEAKPRWILLENVKGFLGSHVLQLWYDCLRCNGYTWREYLLNPAQLGIPNNRTRFYMICERSNRFIKYVSSRSVPLDVMPGKDPTGVESSLITKLPLCRFIKNLDQSEYVVPDKVLSQPWAKQLSVVTPKDTITYCFTGAYGRQYHKATGSLLLMDCENRPACEEMPLDRSDMLQYSGRLRRFAPDELLAIFGFDSFSFPTGISVDNKYKLIGNSVNVRVVAKVATELLQHVFERERDKC